MFTRRQIQEFSHVVRKRWFVGGGLATVALATTVTAGSVFAASPPTSTATSAQSSVQTFVDRLAQNLGLSSDQVQQGIQTTEDQMVSDAVSSGKITSTQGDAIKQQIDSGQIDRFFFGGHGFGIGGPQGHGEDMSVIATTLGITNDQLQSDLSSGTTLKDEITNHGKTVDEVVTAVVAQEKSEMDQAVSAGKMTQDQETQRLSDLQQRLTDSINNNTFGQGGPGGFGGHGHMGGPLGDQGQPGQQSAVPTN